MGGRICRYGYLICLANDICIDKPMAAIVHGIVLQIIVFACKCVVVGNIFVLVVVIVGSISQSRMDYETVCIKCDLIEAANTVVVAAATTTINSQV